MEWEKRNQKRNKKLKGNIVSSKSKSTNEGEKPTN